MSDQLIVNSVKRIRFVDVYIIRRVHVKKKVLYIQIHCAIKKFKSLNAIRKEECQSTGRLFLQTKNT